MLQCVSELFLHLSNGQQIPLRCFEGDEMPTLGKAFTDGMDTLAWTFGRHPEWNDVVWDHRFSAIHFTIFYDRSSNGWYIYDGGFYPNALKMKVPKHHKLHKGQTTDRPSGPNPSTLGTFVNGAQLLYTQPADGLAKPRKQSLHPGDRIFAAGRKIYVSDSLQRPTINWSKPWIDVEEDEAETISGSQAQELLEQQQTKAVPQTNVQAGLSFLERRLANASPLEKFFIYASGTAIAIVILLQLLGAS